MNKTLKLIIKNTSWLMSEKTFTMALNLGVSVYLARMLGPEQFGSLSYILALIAMISPLGALGLNGIISRELINNPNDNDKIVSTSLILRIIGAFASSLICIVIAIYSLFYGDQKYTYGLMLLALGNVFTSLNMFEFWFQANSLVSKVAKMRLLIISIFSLFKILAVTFTIDLTFIVMIFAIETIVTGFGFVLIYAKTNHSIKFSKADFSYGIGLIKQSYWLILSGIAAVIYLKIDQVMLENMVGSHSVGIYSVASRLSEVWYFFADAIVIASFPMMLKLRNNSKEQYYQRLQQLSDILFTSALIIFLIVLVLAKPLINILYGQQYSESALILQIHIGAALFVFMRSMVSKWLIAESLLKYSLVSHGVGAIVNVILNLILIPMYGGVGAAVATVISYMFASYIAFYFFSDTRPVFYIMTKSIILPTTLWSRYWLKR